MWSSYGQSRHTARKTPSLPRSECKMSWLGIDLSPRTIKSVAQPAESAVVSKHSNSRTSSNNNGSTEVLSMAVAMQQTHPSPSLCSKVGSQTQPGIQSTKTRLNKSLSNATHRLALSVLKRRNLRPITHRNHLAKTLKTLNVLKTDMNLPCAIK